MTSPGPDRRSNQRERDELIVEHVARYRMSTCKVLRRGVLAGLSQNAASKILNRLCREGRLRHFPLLHPTPYYVLGEAGAKSLGLSLQRALPLGPQSLPLEYAVLIYATCGRPPRTRLTRREVRQLCAWLPAPCAAAPHCRDVHGVLELIRVDLGGPAAHVARKCAADVNQRRQFREFTELAAVGRFRLVVITATKEKAAALRQSLDQHDWPSGFRIHFSVVPDLLSLTLRKHDA
jgi:hypothetical protein